MQSAPKPCSQCGILVADGTARCQAHKPKVWAKYADSPQRITGRRLQRMRDALFAREPLCRLCAAAGHTTLATIRDHIKPLAEGGTDTDDNIQPICDGCDEVKSKAERLRGRGLGPAAGAEWQGRGGQKSPAGRPETDRFPIFSRAQVSGEGGVAREAGIPSPAGLGASRAGITASPGVGPMGVGQPADAGPAVAQVA